MGNDSTTWDTDASTDPTVMHTQSSQSSPLHGVLLYGGPHTSLDYVNEQILSNVTYGMDEDNENTTTADTTLVTGNSTRSPTLEAESKSFGGQLEEENYKCRALNKLDKDMEDCANQNGSQKKQKD